MARQQRPDGSIPWWPGGRLDPWDHVECAMALDTGGRHGEAERAYRWSRDAQNPDGSLWAAYAYDSGSAADYTKDVNLSTYLAVGVWRHFLCTGDKDFLRSMWHTVERAINFALELQADHGLIYWARDREDNVWPDSLMAGSCSIRAALLCAERIAAELGRGEAAAWSAARRRLERAVVGREAELGETFEDDGGRFAMDWYYPVLCGVIRGDAAQRRLHEGRLRFLRSGEGCRCRDDQPWVTIAESSELAMALDACGQRKSAAELLSWQAVHQDDDGGFRTGTIPGGAAWPEGERPSWTAAALILAADAVNDLTPAAGLFRSLQIA